MSVDEKRNPFRVTRSIVLCGTDDSRRWHLSHGQSCVRCGTDRPVPDYPTSQRRAA